MRVNFFFFFFFFFFLFFPYFSRTPRLRAGEFYLPFMGWLDVSVMLPLGDIAVDSHSNPSHLSVWLKGSKYNPFAQGITLYVGRAYSKFCAVSAVLSYLAVHPQVHGQLFLFQDGSVLSGHRLASELPNAPLSIGLDPSPYRSHSFEVEQRLQPV